MDNFMFWVLSNVGGLGISIILSVVTISLLSVLMFALGHENNGGFNDFTKPMVIIPIMLIMVEIIFGLGFYISANSTPAPVSWFRDLPVGEIDGMKNIMSKHDKPLTIYQFYEAKLSVHKENYKLEQFNAMKED